MRHYLLVSPLALLALAAPASLCAQGLRGDIHVGGDRLSSDGDADEGVSYGLTIAYDAERNGAFVGVQLDLDATDNDACESNLLIPGDRACVRAGRDTAISLRPGVKVGPATELYGTIGYANARFEAEYRGAGIIERDHATLDGIRLGAGVSTALSRRLYGKLEYRYTNYEDGVSRQQGLLGLGLRF